MDDFRPRVPFLVCSKMILLCAEGLNVTSRSSNQARLAQRTWQGVGRPYPSPDLNPVQRGDAVDLEFCFMDVELTCLRQVCDVVKRIKAEISDITVKGKGSQ